MGAAHPGALQSVALRDICVTNGEIRTGPDGRLQIDSPSSRAVLRFRSQPAVEIRFTYLGSSAKSKPLASGELRRQVGIKLRAENTCNLVYAMWHIEPDSRVAVSIKRNPGMSTHEQCHAGGYINLQQSGDAAHEQSRHLARHSGRPSTGTGAVQAGWCFRINADVAHVMSLAKQLIAHLFPSVVRPRCEASPNPCPRVCLRIRGKIAAARRLPALQRRPPNKRRLMDLADCGSPEKRWTPARSAARA